MPGQVVKLLLNNAILMKQVLEILNKFHEPNITRARVYVLTDSDQGLHTFVYFLRAIIQTSFEAPRAGCMFDHGF